MNISKSQDAAEKLNDNFWVLKIYDHVSALFLFQMSTVQQDIVSSDQLQILAVAFFRLSTSNTLTELYSDEKRMKDNPITVSQPGISH